MINQIQTVITALSTFPDRPNYESARKYSKAVAIWLKENKELSEKLAIFIPELNNAIEQINKNTSSINEISLILNGLANYKGDWTSLDEQGNAKVYSIAQSVTHNGVNYISKVDNNIDMPPSANWQRITIDNTIAETTRSFEENEEFIINFSIPRDNPEVVVKKEVIDKGLINTTMNVDGNNYSFKDYSLDTTLTPSGATGNITLTLESGNFATEHIGMIVSGNGGSAVITATDGSASVIVNFTDTTAIASGDWSLKALKSSLIGVEINRTDIFGNGSQKNIINMEYSANRFITYALSNGDIVTSYVSGGTYFLQIIDAISEEMKFSTSLGTGYIPCAVFENEVGNIILLESTAASQITVTRTVFTKEAELVTARTSIATAVYTTRSSFKDFHYDKEYNKFYFYIESYNSSYVFADRLHCFSGASGYEELYTAVAIPATTNKGNKGITITSLNNIAYVALWQPNSAGTSYSLTISKVTSTGTKTASTLLSAQTVYNSNSQCMIPYGNSLLLFSATNDGPDSLNYYEISTDLVLTTPRTIVKVYATLSYSTFKYAILDSHTGYVYLIFQNGYIVWDYLTSSIIVDETLFTGVTTASVFIEAGAFPNGDIFASIYDSGIPNHKIVRFDTGTTSFTPTNKHLVAIADSTVNTNFFTNFNSMTISETLNGQVTNYFFSFDEKNTWCIFIGGVIRNIARDNNGVWEYNSDITYENETWTSASENKMFVALEEAMSIVANHMSGSEIEALTEYPEPKVKFNFGMALYTNNVDETPISDGLVSINYDANSRWEKVPDAEYTYSMLDLENLRFKALTANNLKIRIM
ncbi:hypothetical protein [Halarcobacter sp.]|uniref:hypothetical protein n=1 Tax=Halarcobacter sp. TaxID=2321133 RepID=UPI0029F548E3|nr:hypothetical protein [Halarcobacter sp.]